MTHSNKDKLINLRINKDDYELFQYVCKLMGSTPSKAIRQFIDANINAVKLNIQKENITYDDIKTFLNN